MERPNSARRVRPLTIPPDISRVARGASTACERYGTAPVGMVPVPALGGTLVGPILMPSPPRRSTSWSYIFDTFQVTSFVGVVVALIATIWFSISQFAQAKVPVPVFATAVVIMGAAIVSLAQALRAAVAHGPHEAELRVKRVVATSPPYTKAVCICIVESAVPLSVNTTVLFLINRDCERHLGWGTVRHQESDGLIQVTLDGIHDGMGEVAEALRKRDAAVVDKLLVRLQMSLPLGAVLPPALTSPVTPAGVELPSPSPTTAPQGLGAAAPSGEKEG